MADYTPNLNAAWSAISGQANATLDAASLAVYNAGLNNGTLTMAQVYTALESEPFVQNITNPIIRLYQAAFGRLPDTTGLNVWVDHLAHNPNSFSWIVSQFAYGTEFKAIFGVDGSATINTAVITQFYNNFLNRAPTAGEVANWVGSGMSVANALALCVNSTEFANGVSSGISAYQSLLGAGTPPSGGTLFTLNTQVAQTFTLTTGIDSGSAFTGGNGNDLFDATKGAGGVATLTPLDSIDGGAGVNTLNASQTAGISLTASTTVKNIQTANLTSSSTVAADTSAWTGLTTENVVSVGGETLTLGSKTALKAVDTALAAGTISVDGGTSVNIAATGATTGTITVGAATAPTGAVTISNTSTGNVAMGAINVHGGTTVTISQTNGNAVATTTTLGAVTVTGTTNTTAVIVNNAAPATASGTVAGVTENTVAINDVNTGTTTAGTITAASVSGYTTLNIADTALTTLSVANGSGNIIIDNSGLTTPTNKTLGLTVNGLTGGVLDDADIYTTLNVTTTGANSTLANITEGAVTALTVAGTKGLTLTSSAGLTSLKTVAVSGSAGLTADLSAATVTDVNASATSGAVTVTVDASKATYEGGSGADKVTLSNTAATKAVTLGDGDDTLILSNGTLPTAAISAGNGTDTLQMTAANAATASGSAAFAAVVTGFEHLTLTGATNQTIDLAALGNLNYVSASGGNGLTLSNYAANGTLVLTGAGTAYTASLATATGSSDVLNLTLTDGSGATVAFASTGITAAGVENLNITTVDTQATPSGGFNDTLTVLGNSAKAITVAGNAGLTLTATDTALTSLDASGVSLGGFTFTSGALAAAAAIKGSATGTNTVDFSAATGGAVTYTGGTGSDVITASNGKADIIHLGGGTTTNSVTGTTGNLTIDSTSTGTDTVSLTTGNNTVSLGDGANAFTATTGNNVYTGGAGVDTVTLGSSTLSGVNTITTGTGADVVTFAGVTANGNSYSTITDAHASLQIVFTDAGQISGTTTWTAAKIALADTAVFQDYLDAATVGDGSTSAKLGWFQYNGNTYVVEDNSAATTFQNAGDSVVKLTGLVDLSTANFAATATTSSSLTLV